MRVKQLALMRERNLFLEKCRRIEQAGDQINWDDVQSDIIKQNRKQLKQNVRENEQLNHILKFNQNFEEDSEDAN